MSDRLNRPSDAALPAPRIVHVGLGAFHRAHQAWYTDAVDPDGEWEIVAFTGRRPDAATVLAEQGGLYTLVVRGADGDDFTVIRSIVAAHDGTDSHRLAAAIAAPGTSIVTLTVTEAAYRIDAAGRFRLDDADVAADIAALRARPGPEPTVALRTVPARLVHGLNARRAAEGGPLAVVSCDNLADNGGATRSAVLGVAAHVDSTLAGWIEAHVSFVGTSVDRITPRTTPADVALVEQTRGYRDETPVVTEPFTNWVLCGDFPAGRPTWERAGAVFVDDVGPWETRKLWLLNGAHSLLAYLGSLRGHVTVADAIADPHCRRRVEALWDLAAGHLTRPELDLAHYRAQLLERWRNPRIEHRLAQIALDGSAKLRNRIPELVDAERRRGGTGDAGLYVVAAWIEFVLSLPAVTPDLDAAAVELQAARALGAGADAHAAGADADAAAAADAAADLDGQTSGFLRLIAPAWAADEAIVGRVRELRRAVRAQCANPTDGPG